MLQGEKYSIKYIIIKMFGIERFVQSEIKDFN